MRHYCGREIPIREVSLLPIGIGPFETAAHAAKAARPNTLEDGGHGRPAIGEILDQTGNTGHPMKDSRQNVKAGKTSPDRGSPPGRVKIMDALRSLLSEKDFSTITVAEIARTAGVTEALIYKYFDDKRDLLHQVLAEYLDHYLTQTERDLKGIKGALNKLRKLIWAHLTMYGEDRVFARILLLEVRNYSEYFSSDAYGIVRRYYDMLRDIIVQGVAEGEIRSTIPVPVICQVVFGGIEHLSLPGIIFNRSISPDELTDHLCEIIFNGIQL